jgi:hypothetical protein
MSGSNQVRSEGDTLSVSENVANVLERETSGTIDNWYGRVEKENDLITVALTREQRCAHLPEMFRDIVTRLRDPLPLGTRALTSDAAHDHGCLRREQGYTAAMMVEESRMLQVSIFQTLQLHVKDEKADELLLDVMAIADEVDSQLAQAMTSYISAANQASLPYKS